MGQGNGIVAGRTASPQHIDGRVEEHPKLSRVRLNPQADLKSLPLGPREGFLLSRLDGTPTLEEVADLTGMTVLEAHEMVEQLVALDVLSTLR